jgi:hypothetical protein
MKKVLLIAAALLLISIGCAADTGFALADNRPNLLFFHSDT